MRSPSPSIRPSFPQYLTVIYLDLCLKKGSVARRVWSRFPFKVVCDIPTIFDELLLVVYVCRMRGMQVA